MVDKKQLDASPTQPTSVNQTADDGFGHYKDNKYETQLHIEVQRLRKVLDADFKNQRIVDLEN